MKTKSLIWFLFFFFIFAAPIELFAVKIIRGPYIENSNTESGVLRFRLDKSTNAWLTYGAYPNCNTFMTISGAAYEQKFMLYGLLSDTKHCYRIFVPNDDNTGVYKAAESFFKTFKGQNKPYLEFIAFGDSGSISDDQYPIAKQMEKFNPDFLIHTGDVVQDGLDRDADAQYFLPYKNIIAKHSVFISLGNHEYGKFYKDTDALKFLKKNFSPFHSMPVNGKSPHYYYFDNGNARFISLDVNSYYGIVSAPSIAKDSKQYKWLEWILSRSKQEWNIVFLHEPMYSNGYHGSSERLREVLEPLFLKYNVDLVFQGHDHNYERTYPVKEGEADEDGIIYITLGGGGAPLYFKRTNYDWSAEFIPAYHFAHITIKKNKLNMSVYDKSGDMIDDLEIKK